MVIDFDEAERILGEIHDVQARLDRRYKRLPDYARAFFDSKWLDPYWAAREIYANRLEEARYQEPLEIIETAEGEDVETSGVLLGEHKPENVYEKHTLLKRELYELTQSKKSPLRVLDKIHDYLAAALDI